jgi:DMSO/TMAO reductase YedYZ molybdopterin-dependent catalytic subunit
MIKKSLGLGALVGLMGAALALTAFALGDALLGLPLLPFDFFDWMARALPGDLITNGIDAMVDVILLLGLNEAVVAKPIEQAMAFVMVGGVLLVVSAAFVVAYTALELEANPLGVGGLLGLVVGVAFVLAISTAIPYTPLEAAWVVALLTLWGAALGFAVRELFAPAEEELTVEQVNRREFLVRAGGATAAFTVIGAGVSVALGDRTPGVADGPSSTADSSAFAPATIQGEPVTLPNMDADVQPVQGTRPEYTPLESHYQIDINTRPPVVREREWRLNIEGMVDSPLALTLNDIVTNYESREEFVTLSCISNRIAGSLISTTLWTGVSVRDVLADAGVQEGAQWLFIESADGFFESVNLEMVMNDPRIMFAYAWDRQPLKTKHGFPLRIWIPDRYGMKQPKWIESVTVQEEYEEGYWVRRNWSEDALVQPTSVVDSVSTHMEGEQGQTTVPIGGIAYSGAKGISRVQVRVDEGDWEDAELRVPLSDYTWVIWRYEWPFEEGRHTFSVRCYTGDGELQPTERTDVRPDGATGVHSVTRQL